MAQQSSFFNAELVNGKPDRTYSATDWAEYFATFLGNGIALNPSTTLQVQAGTNLGVIVAEGVAMINGYRFYNSSPLNITLTPANGEYPRITSIVVELNLDNRNITCFAIDGTPSSTPVAPSLQRTASVYQLLLANITVGAGITQLTESNITDMRNSAQCGYIRGLFGSQENKKVSDALANLQKEITTMQNTYLTSSSSPTLTSNWTLAEATNVQFANSNGSITVGMQISGETYMIFNNTTNNAIFDFTPVSSGTDTVNWNSNLNISETLSITENGYFYLINENGNNAVCMQMNGEEFILSNLISGENILTFTPVSSGADTISVFSNMDFAEGVTMNKGADITGDVTFNDSITCDGTANIYNMNVSNTYQSNGTNLWNGICYQTGTVVVNGVDVSYVVTGWYFNANAVASTTSTTCGYFGVLGINLTCSGGVSVSSSFSINLTGTPLQQRDLMWCMGNNVQNVQTEATYTPFYITGLAPSSITISTYNNNTYNLQNEYIRLYLTN